MNFDNQRNDQGNQDDRSGNPDEIDERANHRTNEKPSDLTRPESSGNRLTAAASPAAQEWPGEERDIPMRLQLEAAAVTE